MAFACAEAFWAGNATGRSKQLTKMAREMLIRELLTVMKFLAQYGLNDTRPKGLLPPVFRYGYSQEKTPRPPLDFNANPG